MSVDERCQVKCCERRLMCFISVCLNCPGTLESLSVSQIRCNETRLLSSEDTCLSAVTQANAGGKRAFQEPRKGSRSALWRAWWSSALHQESLMWGFFHYGSPPGRGDIGHTLELVQTSGVWRRKIIGWGTNLTPWLFSWLRLETIYFSKSWKTFLARFPSRGWK